MLYFIIYNTLTFQSHFVVEFFFVSFRFFGRHRRHTRESREPFWWRPGPIISKSVRDRRAVAVDVVTHGNTH